MLLPQRCCTTSSQLCVRFVAQCESSERDQECSRPDTAYVWAREAHIFRTSPRMRDSTAACKGPTLHLGILVFQCRCCLLSFRNSGFDRPPRSRPIHAKRSGLLLVGVNRVRVYSMTANCFSRGEEIPKTWFHKLVFVHRRVGELFILIV